MSTGTGPDTAGAPRRDLADAPPVLQRLMARRRQRGPEGERCEFCSVSIGDDHRHVVDVEQRGIRCGCRGCALLFEGAGAAGGRFATVPDTHLRVAAFVLDPVAWARLQIPVGVVFFMTSSTTGLTTAFYPSPGGATESELPLDAWDRVVDANPVLARMRPDVEAALVRTSGRRLGTEDGEPTCHVVPIDRCYELIGLLRVHWRGFDGGEEVRRELADFVDDVDRRSRAVGPDGEATS